jgi:hypothetical protein
MRSPGKVAAGRFLNFSSRCERGIFRLRAMTTERRLSAAARVAAREAAGQRRVGAAWRRVGGSWRSSWRAAVPDLGRAGRLGTRRPEA